MAQTTYQVILSTDGKHTVIATTDDQVAVKSAFAWAKTTYERIVEHYGHKGQQRLGQPEQPADEAIPECAIHHVAMSRQAGKWGQFWSCHQRNADQSYCSYRPNGH